MAGILEVFMIQIRLESPEDAKVIRMVNEIAFGRKQEAELVDALRDAGECVLSLVADLGGLIVGHVLFTHVAIESSGDCRKAIGLGPIAVLPEHRNQGIGSALVSYGLRVLDDEGYELVVVLGNPKFFGKFKFVEAETLGVKCEFDAPSEAWMIHPLRPGALEGCRGVAHYHEQFKKTV
jgi:putative acetyltransferase